MTNVANSVRDTSTTTGTGDFTLSGTAPSQYISFNTAYGTAVRFPYVIRGQSGTEWEAGLGYLSAATTLVREIVNSSSNSDALVNFSSGTKDVYSDMISREIIGDRNRSFYARYALS